MLRPSFDAFKDVDTYKLQFSLLRPNRTRKLFTQLSWRDARYDDGFGVKKLTFQASLFRG